MQCFLLQRATQRVFGINQLCRWGNWGKERCDLGDSQQGQDLNLHLPTSLAVLPPKPWDMTGHIDPSTASSERWTPAPCQDVQSIQRDLTLAPPNACACFPVGKPIPVQRKKRPSEEEVDQVHQKYLNELCKLFEEHKAKYNIPEDRHLEFI